MSAPVQFRVEAEAVRLTVELLDHLDKYRAAKRRFTDRDAWLKRRYGPTDGEIAGKDDRPMQKAIADCGWWAQEIQVASAALTALNTTLED